jgi:hypothetical protein
VKDMDRVFYKSNIKRLPLLYKKQR